MIRFIFNFIFFGVLFYAIWHFFPDEFNTLVSWAKSIYDFIVEVVTKIIEWISDLTKPGSNGEDKSTAIVGMLNLFW